MNLRQAAQQALEALIPLANAASPNERECLTDEDHERAAEALEALCAALAEHDRLEGIEAIEKAAGIHVSQQAEPEQEPVGHADLGINNIYIFSESEPRVVPAGRMSLYIGEHHD